MVIWGKGADRIKAASTPRLVRRRAAVHQYGPTGAMNILFDLGLGPGLTLHVMMNLIRRQIRRPNHAHHYWCLGEDCC